MNEVWIITIHFRFPLVARQAFVLEDDCSGRYEEEDIITSAD